MSEYAIEKKQSKDVITVERVKVANIPKKLRPKNPGKHVGVLRAVNDHGLWALLQSPLTLFESPLTLSGFQSGDHAIGLVIQPRARGTVDNLVRALTNSSTVLNAWGHTALYVRVDGVIQRVIGFDPFKISTDVLFRGNQVTSGKRPTPGHYNDDAALFQNNSARSVEYPVSRELALYVLESMPHHGPATKFPKQKMQKYVGSPGKYLLGSKEDERWKVGNCISFAMNTIKERLGADIYAINTGEESADTAVIDLGGKLMANQGVLSRNLVYADKEGKKTLVLRWNFNGNTYEVLPKLGSMPTSFVVIKGVGHAWVLTSVARFTAPMIASMLPSPLYGMMPSAPWLLQSGTMARHDSINALTTAFDTLADQYISKEALRYLHQIGMLVGTAYILYNSDDAVAEIVYGVMSAVLPYILEWLAAGTHATTGW